MTSPVIRDDLFVDDLDRIVDAQRFTRLSRSTLYRMMDAGELPFVKLGRCRRIPHRALVELAAKYLTRP